MTGFETWNQFHQHIQTKLSSSKDYNNYTIVVCYCCVMHNIKGGISRQTSPHLVHQSMTMVGQTKTLCQFQNNKGEGWWSGGGVTSVDFFSWCCQIAFERHNVDKLMSVNVTMVNAPLHTRHNRTGELQNLLVLIVFEMHSEILSGKFTHGVHLGVWNVWTE